MQYEEFMTEVARRSGITDPEEARRAAVTVVQALRDRLTGDEAFDLLAQLPARLKKRITITRAPMPMTPEEFLERVAEELGVSPEEARNRVRVCSRRSKEI
jgi:uncharacterized protein (DUF2267 family)